MSTTGFKLLSKKKPTSRTVKSVELSKFYKAKLRNRYEKLFANASELVEITEHPFLDLFKHVNPFTTYSNFIYQTNTYKGGAREGFANGNGCLANWWLRAIETTK